MTKGEKRFLSRRSCAWCDHRLDWDGCGAIYEKCTPEQQAERRAACLKIYKPRIAQVRQAWASPMEKAA